MAFGVATLGIATYSAMDAVMKGLSIASGAYSAVLWRSVAGAVLTGTIFIIRGNKWPARMALNLHIGRGFAAGMSVLLFFWGLVRVPMAQGVALTFLAPLVALYLAAAMLGEQIRRAAILGSVIASVGVVVIAWGQAKTGASSETLLGSGAIILASFLYGFSLVLLRKQAQLADPIEVTLFTGGVIGVLLLIGAPWFAVMPSVAQLPAIGLATLLGTFSAAALAWAYGRAEAQILAPVEYTAFIWAAMLGWIVFGEHVSLYTVAGAGLIIAGCLAAIRGTAAPAPQTEAAA
ncbi:MAG: DMT family transporter [Candidatus Sphingomonas phytovorans]|nr:DMT family transporter [Sphingomonas sp.]WEJ99335.1 MAG: DMT family transporter [Sphingomonas sp.]